MGAHLYLVDAFVHDDGLVVPVLIAHLEATLKSSQSIPAGARWITVKPNGPDEKGVPVLIQETSPGSGVHRVVGGAGGKLNYLRLRGVKSESQYRQEESERRKVRAAAKKERAKRDKDAGLADPKKAARDDVNAQKRQAEREFIATVAEAMGWKDHEPNPDSYANLSERAQRKAASQHHREWLAKAKEAVEANSQQLLADHDARSAVLGEVPLETPDDEVISLADLDQTRTPSGLGYSVDYKQEAKAKGLTKDELAEEKAQAEESVPEEVREATQKRRETSAALKAEMETVRDPGPKDAEVKLVAAERAVDLIKARKKLQAIQKQAREANQEIDAAKTEPGTYVLEVGQSDLDEAVKDQIQQDMRTLATRNFLSELDRMGGERGKHLGIGAYNAVNSAALVASGASLVDRQAVDVLGVAGAAQVLARRLHNDLTPDEVKDLADGLEAYHFDHYLKASEDAIAEAQRWQGVAEGIELEAAENGHDLARMQELNAKRREAIDNAERIMSQTLGEMEAGAALIVAMKQGAKDSIEVALGDMSIEDAITRARAIGLQRGDYKINSVGSTRFLTISGAGMDRIAKPVNREDLETTRRALAIMEGHQDEDGWLAKGMARRPDLAAQAEPGQAPRFAQPYNAAGRTDREAIEDYIGARAADGDAPEDILADLLSSETMDKTADPAAFRAAIDAIAPLRDDEGKMIRAQAHKPAFEALADAYVERHYGGKRSPLHRQSVPVDETSVEALHRALAAVPEGVQAYKSLGEMGSKDRKALRDLWWKEIGKLDPKAAGIRADLDAHAKAEPEKTVTDMFGDETENPAWSAWRQKRDELGQELDNAELTWAKYAKVMDGPEKAYAAVQDIVRSRVAEQFHRAYNTLRPGSPLKLGRDTIRGDLDHLDAVDPEAREKRLADHRKLVDSLRERNQGRYASGAVSERIAETMAQRDAFRQSQMGLFADEEPEQEKPLEPGQRHTLGQQAERTIAGMMNVVGPNFRAGKPVKMWAASQDGKYVHHQRAIKLLENSKRLVLAQGVGSGKTVVGLSAFTHLQQQGKAKRGLFVVPSVVQGQFGGEALRYLEPGKYKWHAEPGASHEERLAAYRDPDTHFTVVTHQAFRDDLVNLAAERDKVSRDEIVSKLRDMDTAERKAWMRGVMDHAGMDHDFLMVDEGHDLLGRAGKKDSTLANVVDAVAHNTGYYVSASADPVKNDPSELYSLMHKIDPDRYNDPRAFMRKYGVDTPAAKNELRREVARYFHPASFDPRVKVDRQRHTVPLSSAQSETLAKIERASARARLARMKGGVDVEAMRTLSPSSFEGHDEARHAEIAKRLQSNLGIIKDAAMRRAIDEHDKGGKIDAIARLAADRKGKPGVVFARSLKAVDAIKKRLEADGHRVVTLTGKHTGKEKEAARLAFAPESWDASADILVASDAGAVGLNLQRGQWLVQHDIPMTAKTHEQRNGRIHRGGQKNDIELIDLVADHHSERRALDRLSRKAELRGILTSPMEGLDDQGLASYVNRARVEREESSVQGGLF